MFHVGDSAGQSSRGSQGHRDVVVRRLEVREDQPGAPVRGGGGQQREEQQGEHPATLTLERGGGGGQLRNSFICKLQQQLTSFKLENYSLCRNNYI